MALQTNYLATWQRQVRAALLVGLCAGGSLAAAAQAPTVAAARVPRAYTRAAHLMGSHFTFTAVSADDSLAW
ncbi:hypothetical protein ACFQ48_10005, partial [Hymenobacter caeli]